MRNWGNWGNWRKLGNWETGGNWGKLAETGEETGGNWQGNWQGNWGNRGNWGNCRACNSGKLARKLGVARPLVVVVLSGRALLAKSVRLVGMIVTATARAAPFVAAILLVTSNFPAGAVLA